MMRRRIIALVVTAFAGLVLVFALVDRAIVRSAPVVYPLSNASDHPVIKALRDNENFVWILSALGALTSLLSLFHAIQYSKLIRVLAGELTHHVQALLKKTPARRADTLADVMARVYNARSARAAIYLFVAVIVAAATTLLVADRRLIVAAAVVAVLYLLAILRQALTTFRISKGFFGASEHEVRQLLLFLITHDQPEHFTDGGHAKPAFDVAEELRSIDLAAAEPELSV